ncbi:MAG: AGE family epimerase/isomerase [Microscillaceae bacterium]|nr:AGE family epimerase/isomerase [Microscillaceae bacterium]
MLQLLKTYRNIYQNTLLQDVIPFWEKNSPDQEFGGYFSCLNRDGKVFDTDKFIWMQARQVWTFSMLYNEVEQRQSWLDMARLGAEFLKKYGRDAQGNWYFSLNREGKPLMQAFKIGSDFLACMAFAQYGKAAQEQESLDISLQTYQNILLRRDNPKGIYNKAYPGTRPLKSFGIPMVLSNLVYELEDYLSPQQIEETLQFSVREVLDYFWKPERQLIFENIQPNGELSDSFEGRLINPGHGMEAMWFIMDIAHKQNDQALIIQCKDILLAVLEFGWDREYEGFYYYLDADGHPPLQLEWNQKLWWVHLEALVALSKAYLYTGDPQCWEWYEKVHRYTWTCFPDPEYGEWFGYLNRKGEVLLPLKGGKWKGCYHVPRSLYLCGQVFERLLEKEDGR